MKIVIDTSQLERLDAVKMAEFMTAVADEYKSPNGELIRRMMRHAAKLLREQAAEIEYQRDLPP